MKSSKLFFILSLMGILTIIIFSQNNQTQITGKITSINYSKNIISISLENNPNELIIFTNKIPNLSINNKIYAEGKKEIYKNKSQITINKINKLSD